MGNIDLWNSFREVQTGSKWFKVHELDNDVIGIYEPYHFQEVISYLISGTETSLLLDTGMGLSDIRKVAESLTDKPIRVINSHVHFDHVGCNHLFDEVMVYNQSGAIKRLRKGYSHEDMIPQLYESLFEKIDYIDDDVDLENFTVPPSNPVPVDDGYEIDLGGRVLKVIHTPGHSPESIMLHDEKNELLFTGDSFYPGYLYAHFAGEFYQDSDLKQYAATMKRISKLTDKISLIHPSHNDPYCAPTLIGAVADALTELSEGRTSGKESKLEDLSIASLPERDECPESYIILDDLYVFKYNGFQVITGKI